MVRITVDTAQDDASTIRSIITLLNQELAKKGSRPEYVSSRNTSDEQSSSNTDFKQQGAVDSQSSGGAFQHQDTSGLMSMFSEDLPSTDPKNFESSQRPQQQQQSSQNTWEDSGSFLFGNIEDVAGSENPSPDSTSDGNSSRYRVNSSDDEDDDFSVTEYH